MKYYLTERPAAPGAYPPGVTATHNYESKTYIPEIDAEAWGEIEYAEPLSPKDVAAYELTPENMKKWYHVMAVYSAEPGTVRAEIVKPIKAEARPEDTQQKVFRPGKPYRIIEHTYWQTKGEAKAYICGLTKNTAQE